MLYLGTGNSCLFLPFFAFRTLRTGHEPQNVWFPVILEVPAFHLPKDTCCLQDVGFPALWPMVPYSLLVAS